MLTVTGCAGFIGSHVAERLLGEGRAVLGIDSLNDSYDVRLKEQNLSVLTGYDGFEFHRLDIRDMPTLEALLEERRPESMIHIAARVGVRASVADPYSYYENNVLGTLNMLECARKFKPSNFVLASSSSLYGNRKRMPFSEADTTDNPVSPYAASKKSCEVLCHVYASLHGLKVSCLRFFTAYGPRNRPDMATFKFMDAIAKGDSIEVYGDGTSMRDYTYVDDIVSGVVAAVDTPMDYEILNLGNAEPVLLNDFITLMEEVVGRKSTRVFLPVQNGDVERTCADIRKARAMLGYNPATSLREGLAKMYSWYLEKIAER